MKRTRSSFSVQNALRFKRIFDQAIVNRKNVRIKIKGSPVAYHTKCSDALKWLMLFQDQEHIDSLGNKHEQGAYARLRGEIKFRHLEKDPEYIRLSFVHFEQEPAYQEMDVEAAQSKSLDELRSENKLQIGESWKEKLLREFVESDDKSRVYKMEGLRLNEDEQAMAESILKQIPNCVFDVDEVRITAYVPKIN
jgi:hypothetical protein